jgi:S-formylglutathione hydrolase FrmB
MQGERGIATLSQHACFGGVPGCYQHDSEETGTPIKFGVFVPPQAKSAPVPVLYFLAGLTCNEATFAIKARAQQYTALHGLRLVTPDTSPRGTRVDGADANSPAAWESHDATELVKAGARVPPLLIEQGLADKFLANRIAHHARFLYAA